MSVVIAVSDPKTSKTSQIELSDTVFNRLYNEGLVHQVVTAYLAAGRQGSKAQKTRSEVRGGGRKPWKQKGTGRARAGTIRSPIWRGGGVTFAAKPRNYQQKVNKKMYKGALCNILSELNRCGNLLVLTEIECNTHKTKDFTQFLRQHQIDNALIITSDADKNIYLAARNIPNIEVIDVQEVNPFILIKYKKVVCTQDAILKLNEKFQ